MEISTTGETGGTGGREMGNQKRRCSKENGWEKERSIFAVCWNIHLRLDVLAKTSFARVVVLGHVTSAAAACRHNGCFQHRRLEIGGLDGRRLRCVGHVASAAAPMGSKLRSHWVTVNTVFFSVFILGIFFPVRDDGCGTETLRLRQLRRKVETV